MNRNATIRPGLIAVIFNIFFGFSVFSQGTAFNYQGQLSVSGSPAGGNYDFAFTLYNAVTNGSAVSGTLTNYDVPVTDGLFTTTLDFGAAFAGQNLWLDIAVRTNGSPNFTTLSPLQPILPVPYAIFANSASNLVGVLPASQLSGTLPATAFTGYTNTVALTNGANLFSGAFSGNGGAVTNVNVTNLTGVLADSQLPANTAYVNSNQTFTASNMFTGANTFTGVNTFTNMRANSFSGSFFGNGLVGWLVVTGTTVQANIDTGYLLTNSQTVTVTLPTSPDPGDIVRIACAGASGWQLGQNAGQSVLGNFLSFNKPWIQTYALNQDWKCIASSPDGTVMAAAYSGNSSYGQAISKSSGQSWTSLANPDNFTWQAMAVCPNDETLALAALDEPILISTNLGSTWTQTTSGSYDWTCMAPAASGNYFVAACSGTGAGIYTNSGTTWVQRVTGGTWTSVSLAAGGSELMASASGAGIYYSTDGGGNWNPLSGAGASAWNCVACSAAGNRIIAGINSGGLYLSTNSGTSFTLVAGLPTSVDWSGVASSADGSKLQAAVNNGYIYTSVNWGATWTSNSISAAWVGLVSSADGTKVAAAIDNSGSSGNYGIYASQAGTQSATTTGTAGYIFGSQASAVELQYIGNNEFMPVSFSGNIWAY